MESEKDTWLNILIYLKIFKNRFIGQPLDVGPRVVLVCFSIVGKQETKQLSRKEGRLGSCLENFPGDKSFAVGIYSCKGQILEIYKIARKGIRRSSHASSSKII